MILAFRKTNGTNVQLLIRQSSLREQEAKAKNIQPDASCKPKRMSYLDEPKPKRRRKTNRHCARK